MSADPQQQIDITPYKVIRENVITSNQQKVPEVRPPTTDLATSILDKLTEIKDNLYPSHLNIPPQKFGQPTGYISPLPGSVNNLNPSQAIEHPAEGLETLLRKDTYVSSIPNSRDQSPEIKSPGSPFYFPSPGHSKIHHHGDLSADLNHDLAHAIQENIYKKTAMEIRSGSNSPILFTGGNTLTPPRVKSPISRTQNIITASLNEDLYSKGKNIDAISYFISQGTSPGHKSEKSEHLRESFPSTAMNSKAQTGEMAKSGVGSNLQGEIASNSNYSLPQFNTTDVRSSLQSQSNNQNEPRQEYSQQQRSDLLASVNRAQATFGYNASKSPVNTLASSPAKGKVVENNYGSPSYLPNVNSVVTEEDSYIIAENKANRAVNPQQQYTTAPTPKNRPQADGDDISQSQGSLPQSRRDNIPESSSTRNSQVGSSNSQREQAERDNYEQTNRSEIDQRSQPQGSISSTRNSQVRSSNSQRDQGERENYETRNQDSSKPPRCSQDDQRENIAAQGSTRSSQVRSSNSQREQGDYEQSNYDSSRPQRCQEDQRENIPNQGSTRNSQVRSSNSQREQFERDNYEQSNQDFSRPQRAHQDDQRENIATQGSTRNSQVRSSNNQREQGDYEQPNYDSSRPQRSQEDQRENIATQGSTRNSQVGSSNIERDNYEQSNYDSSRPQRARQDEQRENIATQSSTRNSQVRLNQQGRDNYEATNQDEEEISQPHFAGSQNKRENTSESSSLRNSQVRSSKQQSDRGERLNSEQTNQDEPSSQNRRENIAGNSTRNSQVRSSKQSDQVERDNYEQSNYDSSRPQRSQEDQRENIPTQGSTRNSQVRSSKQRDQDEIDESQGPVSQNRRENVNEGSTRNSQARSSNNQRDQEEIDNERYQPQPSSQNRRENTAENSSTRNSQVRSTQQGRDNYEATNQGEVDHEGYQSQPASQNRRENAGETSSTRNSQVRSNKQERDRSEATNQDEVNERSQPQGFTSQNRRENTTDENSSTRNSQARSSNQQRDQGDNYETRNQDSSKPPRYSQDDQRENTTEDSTRNSQIRSNQQHDQGVYETRNQNSSKPPRYSHDDQEDQGSFVNQQQKQRPEQQNKRYNNEDTEGSITPKQRADTPSDNGRRPDEMTLQSRRQKEAEGNIEASKRRSENVADNVRQMEKIQELEEMMAQSRKKSQNEPGHSKRRSESHYENLKLQDLPGKRRENADTSEQGSMISKYRSETPSEYSNPGDMSHRSQYGKSEQTTPRKSKKADDPYYEENNNNFVVKSRPELQSQGPTPKNSQDNTPKNQFEVQQQKPQGKIISNRVGANAEQGAVASKQKAEQSLGQIVKQAEERTPQGTTAPLDPQALDKRFSFGLVVSDVSERESGPDTDSDRRYYLSKQAEEHARKLGVEGSKKKSGYVRGPNTSEDQDQLSNRLENSSKPNTQREETEEIDERQESQESQDSREQIIQEEKQFRKERRGHRQNQRNRDQTENDPQDQPQPRRGEENTKNDKRSARVQNIPESLPEESNEESVSSSSKIKADESSEQNDVKQRNFTFVSRTSGTDSSQQMVNNTLSSSAHKMDTDRGLNTDRSNQPNDSVVIEKKKPTKPATASISPPRRQGGDSMGSSGGGMTAYITLEHEKKSKSTKTQPSSLNNINENDPKTQPPSVKNIDDPQQTMNRNSSQMNLSTPNNPTSKKPTLDNLSPPNITLQVPPSGMGTRQHSPMHQMHNFQNHLASPNGMNPMHPMMNQMGQQMGQQMNQMGGMFPMSNLSSIPNISNMHTPMNNMSFPNMPNMPLPMPNFNEGGHAGEYQKYILMMMNYYENHLSNLKTMCVQQNEVLNQEKLKNQNLEHRNSELVKKIQELDSSIKEQYTTFENSQKELKTRYEVVLDELSNVKKGLAARQVGGESSEGHAPRPVQVGDINYQTMLYNEIISLRKDLDNQRQTMYDFRSTSRHLEDQMRDLEKVYIDELKNNVSLGHKREQIQDTLDKYKTDYLKMDTLNKIILDGYERTRKDFEELKTTTHLGGHAENTNDYESNNNNREQIDSALNSRDRSRQPSIGYNVHNEDKKREILLRSISPLRYEAEDNKDEMLRNKMRAQESQVKELLQWNANSSKAPVVYTQTYPAPNSFNQQQHHHHPQQMGHTRGNPIVQNTNPITGGQSHQMFTSSQAYGAGNYNSNSRQQQQAQMQMQQQQQQQQQQQYNSNPRGQQQRIQQPPPMMNDQRGGAGGRVNVTFPSYQKIEDNKDEIQRTDYELSRLTQHRKIIENELFKMPSTAKSLDQKRKKAALEMELEGIDYQIEDCKNKLRKYDVLTVKV